jgi:hypothetical protein
MKITNIRITNFMGIEARDIAVPPSGFVASGECGSGKSSILHAVRSALVAQRIAPSAIRNGTDRAEILIDIDDVTVKRVITAKSSTLSVERGGMKASKPQAFLTDLVGASPVDPLALYLEKPKDRRAMILAALPITVTREQLAKYATDLPIDFDASGHGLEVIERARKFFYDERALANKEVSEAKATAERLTKEGQQLSSAVTPGPALPIEDARAAVAEAERALLALENRATEAAKASERTASQRTRIAELRASAGAPAPAAVDVDAYRVVVADAKALVVELEERIRVARHALAEAQAQLDGAIETNATAEREKARALDLAAQASTLEAALAAATVVTPTDAEITTANVNVGAARALLARAEAQSRALAAVAAAKAATDTLRALEGEAAELDDTVKRLANDAPADLLATSEGIRGLSLEGDDVLLDGKRLDDLCGAEAMRFAVEIARRANATSKILVVDGLERLDSKQSAAFIHEATSGGYQLIATRVADGGVVIEAIESDDEAKAAE